MSQTNVNYKEMNEELEDIMRKLQSADIDVDESIDLYERGMSIAKDIDDYLEKSTNKVDKLKINWEERSKL